MFRTTVPCLGLLAWGVGCSEWPRFSHRTSEGFSKYDRIPVSGTLTEGPEPGWPDIPIGLVTDDSQAFGDPFWAVDIHGTASPVAHLVGGPPEGEGPPVNPFPDCPNMAENLPVNGSYAGDVDFVRFSPVDDQYGLCLVLQTDPVQPDSAWDLIAYQYDDQQHCTVGGYVTEPAGESGAGYAAYTLLNDHNFVEPGHSDLALYIAGSVGTLTDVDLTITYDVFVYPVRDVVGCADLNPAFFQSGAQ